MTYKIISKQPFAPNYFIVKVQLIADTDFEKKAIQNLQIFEAADKEKEYIENYLNFNLELGDYSIIDAMQEGNVFILKVYLS